MLFVFPVTLQVYPLFMFLARFCVVSVDIYRTDFCGPCWDNEWSWVRRHDKCGAWRYGYVHRVGKESSDVSVYASSSTGWNRRLVFFHCVPHCDQAFVVMFQCNFWKHTMWEDGDHLVWGRHSNGHLGFYEAEILLVG